MKIPERIGWTLLRRIVKAKRMESLLKAWSTGWLVVNMRASSLWKNIISTQNIRPIMDDCVTDTIVANLAPFPFPAPSSFATRTLCLETKTCTYILSNKVDIKIIKT